MRCGASALKRVSGWATVIYLSTHVRVGGWKEKDSKKHK